MQLIDNKVYIFLFLSNSHVFLVMAWFVNRVLGFENLVLFKNKYKMIWFFKICVKAALMNILDELCMVEKRLQFPILINFFRHINFWRNSFLKPYISGIRWTTGSLWRISQLEQKLLPRNHCATDERRTRTNSYHNTTTNQSNKYTVEKNNMILLRDDIFIY